MKFAIRRKTIAGMKINLWMVGNTGNPRSRFGGSFLRLLPTAIAIVLSLPMIVSGQQGLISPTQSPQATASSRLPGVIDHSLTGWNGAGPESEGLGEQIRANWVMLGETGSLPGTVTGKSVPGMSVFALRDGFVVSSVRTDASGAFQLEGLNSGAHTIVGYNADAFFAYGIHAIDFRADAVHMPRRILTQAINSTNKFTVGRLVEEHSPLVQFPVWGKYSIAEDDIAHARYFGLKGLANFDVESVPATSIQSQTVALGPHRRLQGRIHQVHNLNGRPVPLVQTTVRLIQNGKVVAESGCDRYGVFEFSNLVPGETGLVAAGADGFAAIGISLVDFRQLETISSRKARRNPSGISAKQTARLTGATTVRQKTGLAIDLMLIQPESIGWLNHFVNEQAFVEARSKPRPQRRQHCVSCSMPFYGQRPPCSCYRQGHR